jgi:hypothetical protein
VIKGNDRHAEHILLMPVSDQEMTVQNNEVELKARIIFQAFATNEASCFYISIGARRHSRSAMHPICWIPERGWVD